MKKNGFTLAEILVALAVVGIIAAITIPTLSTESMKKVWANSLSSAVSDFENAMTTYLMTEREDSLIDTKAWLSGNGGYIDDIGNTKAVGKHFKLEKISNKPTDFYNDKANTYLKHLNPKITTSVVTQARISGPAYKAKSGVVYFVHQDYDKTAKITLTKGGKLEQKAGIVGIDVNGVKGPNRVGRDVFVYMLGADGYLFPFGSKDVNVYSGIDEVNENNCSTSVTGTVGEHCAARLARNGYKMDY